METDGDLLGRYAQENAEEAFAGLVQRHVGLVFRAALRQWDGDHHRAEEATQLVFTLLARNAAKLARHPSLTGWLYTTTHFTISDLRRREYARQRREREAHAMHETAKPTRGEADWTRLRPVLDEAMQQLRERDREALLARFFEGRSLREVGARIALGEDAARMRVERALEKLRALLARRGVNSTGAALGLALASEAAGAIPAGLAASVTGSALASAAVSAGAVAGPLAVAIQFMSTSKIAAGLAGLVLIATAGIGVHEFSAAQAEEPALATARSETAQLAAKVRELDQRAGMVASETATLNRALASMSGATSPAGGPSMGRGGGGRGGGGGGLGSEDLYTPEALAAGREFAAKHPEARRAIEATQQRAFEGMVSGYAVLQLSPEEYEAIYGEFVRLWPWEIRIGGIRASISAGRSQSTLEIDPFVRALVGEERFKRVENARRNRVDDTAVHVVQTLAGATYDLDSPLTAAQAEALRSILQQHPVRNRSVWLQPAAPEWAAVRPQLEKVLSSEQLARLDLARASEAVNARSFR